VTGSDFNDKVKILSDLWMNYRDDEEFEDFCDYNDIGLPLAYFVSSNLVTLSDIAEIYINETFDLLCAALSLPNIETYTSLEEMFALSNQLNKE